MRWCLRVKLAQNWRSFSKLLLETEDCPLVEESRRDSFWGAKPALGNTLVGMNVLGRLLMELREDVKSKDAASLMRVDPLSIPTFLLAGQPIETISVQLPGGPECHMPPLVQTSMFDNLSEASDRLLEPSTKRKRKA